MKRIIALLLMLVLLLSMFAGCSKKNKTEDKETSNNQTQSTEQTDKKEENIDATLQQWIDNNKDNNLTKEEIEYYKPDFNKENTDQKTKTEDTDMQKISDTTVEYIKKNTTKYETHTEKIENENGVKEDVIVSYPWTHTKEGKYENLSGEYVYQLNNDVIDAKYFIAQLTIHQQIVEQGFSFTELDKQKNQEMIKSIMTVFKNFYNTDSVMGFSYKKITFNGEKYIDNPSVESIEKDLNKILTMDGGLYAMHLLIPTEKYTAIFEITYTGESTLELRITTNEYIQQ